MGEGVEILKKKGIWKLYFTIYCINPKDARTTEGKFGYGRYYTSPSEENYIQALNRGLYHAVKLSQEMIERNPEWTIARISWGDKLNFLNKDGVALINDSIKVSIDDYTPTPEDLKRTYESEIIFESMDCCIWCGRKEGPYSDAKLVACKGCPELVCQYCNLEELGCKMCFKEDDLSFESPDGTELAGERRFGFYNTIRNKSMAHLCKNYKLGPKGGPCFNCHICVKSGRTPEKLMELKNLDKQTSRSKFSPMSGKYGYWDYDGNKHNLSERLSRGDIDLEDSELEYFESTPYDAEMTKDGKDYVSRKIATIMRDWKKTGKIGNSSPKDSKTAQRQAIAVAFSMAARKGFKGTKKAEEDYFYFDELAKKHGIMSNKLLLGSLAVVLSIASIGNMMVKTAVNAKELVAEEDSEKGCGCGCKKKGGCN
tara:strand:- start:1073 stop:2350 length:1278 start_codon:yes stop_codon:yes gene_type:complete